MFGELKQEVLPQKPVLYLYAKMKNYARPENATLWTSLSQLYKTSLGRFCKNLKLKISELFLKLMSQGSL